MRDRFLTPDENQLIRDYQQKRERYLQICRDKGDTSPEADSARAELMSAYNTLERRGLQGHVNLPPAGVGEVRRPQSLPTKNLFSPAPRQKPKR